MHAVAKAGDPSSIPDRCLGFFFSSWLTNIDGMKDLWCSSTAQLIAIITDMSGKIYSAIVQFSCYQHGFESREGSVVL